MAKRPLSITLIGWLFIAAGTVGLLYHATEFKTADPFQFDVLGVSLIRILAIVGGIFALRGRNWARWLLLAWLAFHVIISAFHTLPEVVMHAILLAMITYFLFRPPASAYFQSPSHPPTIPA